VLAVKEVDPFVSLQRAGPDCFYISPSSTPLCGAPLILHRSVRSSKITEIVGHLSMGLDAS
jgi:hypothetical protein